MQAASTQSNIPIAGIKDGIVILKDGQYRIILEIAAINFDLKSEQEQNSLIFQYQSFLNSLHFPVQITIQSKKLDLSPYLKKIQDLANKQTNELIKIQTQGYVEFVGQLINLANIMKKRFYVTVGYQPLVVSNSIIDKIFKRQNTTTVMKISEGDFDTYSKELRQRANTVAQGLGAMGLHCKQMVTQEIIENLYEIYNPEVAGKERLSDTEQVSSAYITQSKPQPKLESGAETNTQIFTGSRTMSEPVIDNTAVVLQQQKNVSYQALSDNAKESEPQDKKDLLPGEAYNNASKASANEAIGPNQVIGNNNSNQPVPGATTANASFVDAPNPEEISSNQNYGT